MPSKETTSMYLGMDFVSCYRVDVFHFVNYAPSRFLHKDQRLIVLLVRSPITDYKKIFIQVKNGLSPRAKVKTRANTWPVEWCLLQRLIGRTSSHQVLTFFVKAFDIMVKYIFYNPLGGDPIKLNHIRYMSPKTLWAYDACKEVPVDQVGQDDLRCPADSGHNTRQHDIHSGRGQKLQGVLWWPEQTDSEVSGFQEKPLRANFFCFCFCF